MGVGATFPDYSVLYREADKAAIGLAHRLSLPASDRHDLRQDLLLDLLARSQRFNPCRGTLGAFAGIVVKHRASRLVARFRRNRTLWNPISLDQLNNRLNDGTSTPTRTELRCSIEGSLATDNWIPDLSWQLDLYRVLEILPATLRPACVDLLGGSVRHQHPQYTLSRATHYRMLHELRLRLLAVGLGSQRETFNRPSGYVPVMSDREHVRRITEAELCAWFGAADPGATIIYHRGCLARDRSQTTSRLTPRDRAELARVAQRAMAFANEGLVDLVQQRYGDENFAYILVVRQGRPHAKPRASPRTQEAGDDAGWAHGTRLLKERVLLSQGSQTVRLLPNPEAV